MRKELLFAITIILVLVAIAYAIEPSLDYDDDYTTHGNDNDGIVWKDGYIDVEALDTPSGTNAVCWDWEGNNKYNECRFLTGIPVTECDDNFQILNEANQLVNPSTLSSGTCLFTPGVCEFVLSTSQPKAPLVITRVMINCTSGNPAQKGVNKQHYVINKKKYDCDGEFHSVNASYDLEGQFNAVGDQTVDIQSGLVCPANKVCDENHDDTYVTSPAGSIPDACRTQNGFSCSVNDSCVSDLCFEVTCRDSSKPFFEIKGTSPSSTNVSPGDTITFTVNVTNRGNVSGQAYVGGTVKRPDGATCNTEWKATSTPVSKNSNASVILTWKVPSNYPGGNYSFISGTWNSCSGKQTKDCWDDGLCTQPKQDDLTRDNLFNVTIKTPDISVSPGSLVFDV